jgi:hypothetical protein
MLIGLSQLNLEITSRCDKKTLCFMCGHQSESVNPNLQFGDMDFALMKSIRAQLSPGVIISCHRDGDPLTYPRLGEALRLFEGFPVSIVTHGEALDRRADEIIDNATTVTVSVIPNDHDREIQLNSIRGFLEKKGSRRPQVQLKCVGMVQNLEPYEALGVPIINRALHSKNGNWNYYRIDPIVPEVRVCLDFLGRPTVDWRGRVFCCNRLDTSDAGLIGDLNTESLDAIWNGPKRQVMLQAHLAGRRDLANNLCKSCQFWGISTPAG